jgi:hypothetical protein
VARFSDLVIRYLVPVGGEWLPVKMEPDLVMVDDDGACVRRYLVEGIANAAFTSIRATPGETIDLVSWNSDIWRRSPLRTSFLE